MSLRDITDPRAVRSAIESSTVRLLQQLPTGLSFLKKGHSRLTNFPEEMQQSAANSKNLGLPSPDRSNQHKRLWTRTHYQCKQSTLVVLIFGRG